MIKFLKDMDENDYGVIKYEVLVLYNVYKFVSDRYLHTEEIASFLDCDEEDIVQIDFEDYD